MKRCLSLTSLSSPSPKADMVELRCDLAEATPAEVEEWIATLSLPVMLTVGSLDPAPWAALGPNWLDIPYDQEAPPLLPQTRLLRSFHNYEDGEVPWNEILATKADLHKVAVTPRSTQELLDLFSRSNSSTLVVAMGEVGQPLRLLSHHTHNPWMYYHQGDSTAAGQLSIEDAYQGKELLGLIGDPVDKSPSHISHNGLLRASSISANYVKWKVTPEELPKFLAFVRTLPLRGLSVTMPLKEAVAPLLDWAQGPVINTIVHRNGSLLGYNTDGRGALDAIEERTKVEGKRFVLIGAGGTAQAIAHEARKRGADVSFVNRSRREVPGFPLHPIPTSKPLDGDVVVQTTPVGFGDPMATPLPADLLPQGTLVLDAIHSPPLSRFLNEAKERGCEVISGVELFVNQAVHQFLLWYPDQLHKETVREQLWQYLPTSRWSGNVILNNEVY